MTDNVQQKGSGFAAATPPVTASLITTDTDGLDTGTIDLSVDGQAVPVYVARPAATADLPANVPANVPANLPVILVVSEIFGVHEHIADVARRFAKQGYLALAPHLFVRQGDPSAIADIPTLFRDIVSQAPDAQVNGDLDACVAWAAQNGGDVARLGITGFCWGGRVTWLYAAHNPAVKAGVAWYGRLAGDTNDKQTSHAIDVAAALTVPVLGLYGAKDTGIPLDTVNAMKAALAQGSSGSEIVVYPDAGHAFYADYRLSYSAPEAQDGWTRALAWFARHGVA